MKTQTEIRLREALSYIENADPQQASQITSRLFVDDIASEEVFFTNQCCSFWINTKKQLEATTDLYEKGDRFFSEWKSFLSWCNVQSYIYKEALYSFQKGYFSDALTFFQGRLEDKEPRQRAESYRKAGLCYKMLGNFENAKMCLTSANNIYPNIAPVLAELADCYALCGESKFGKVLFREAFFINPETIDLDFLESELIECLVKKTKEKGYSNKYLLHWIPVYGVLSGVLNIKRELNAQEVGRLKQAIYAMENDLKDPSCDKEMLTPKLLNHYFRLIDHFIITNEGDNRINEILIRIKILDTSIYEMYKK